MTRYTVIIIGSGFGGQAAAVNLRALGIEDFLILERRSRMGGTWSQNSYPGAAVDVQSPLYSLSFEPYPWSRMFAGQGELVAYTDHVLEKHGLRARTCLAANVVRAEWLPDAALWQIDTEAQGRFTARFLINASGPLSMPLTPPFPGRESFRGRSFHTNAWDHGCALRGKRVAVIGSGASAAQVIPAIAQDVAELHVFQRTPHWVVPRHDRVFSRLEQALLAKPLVFRAVRAAIYWNLESRVIGFKYSRLALRLLAERGARRHLAAQVPDPLLRAKLTPDYTIGCKRVVVSSTLYPALARPNVHLHARDEGVAEITPEGIRTVAGTTLDLDVIVYATGYDATDGAIPYPVTGREGLSLQSFWAEFPRAYLGTAVPGFPNLFLVGGPNTGIGHTSAIFVIESQMEYIRRAITAVQTRGARSIEVTSEAESAYTAMIHHEMRRTVWQSGGCESWYRSRSGRVTAIFPGFSFSFRRLARRFQNAHHLFR